ncbi:hypothetical protein AB0O34_14485 [Sphaerisporangium sp. NPDC088356]|uniref:hypothetical protein n=1 Tax=Sphaerisporangium sp. NPDC088356 TaxID=3154871 RepID=UPI00342BA129
MGAAIADAVSSPGRLILPVVAVIATTFLGVLLVILVGNAQRVAKITWKNRFVGELALTYRTDDSAEESDDEPGGEVDKPPELPAWRRWLRKQRKRE